LTIESNKLVFIPADFELYGTSIKFTVNDQVTEAEIIVYKGFEVDFEYSSSPTAANVFTFFPFGEIPDNSTFEWDFGDGNTSSLREPTHTYELTGNQGNSVEVKLTVLAPNGICRAEATQTIEILPEEISIDLEPKDFCENDDNHYPFTVVPENATGYVISGNDGVINDPDNPGRFVFVPALAGIGQHSFTVNGEETELNVEVHQQPFIGFEPNQVGNTLVITNNSTGNNKYVWTINNDIIEKEDNSPITFELHEESPNEWLIHLRVITEFCGEMQAGPVTFITEYIPPQGNECFEITKEAIIEDLEMLKELNLTGSNIVAEIWEKTSKKYGGTEEFNNGVLDDIAAYLSGQNNGVIAVEMRVLLQETLSFIQEIDRDKRQEEFNRLVLLFMLQLKLVYNILACQDNDLLSGSKPIISLLNGILAMLRILKNMEVNFPSSLKEFLDQYYDKVEDIDLLREHLDKINNDNLILFE
jgi:PKD repeat protein